MNQMKMIIVVMNHTQIKRVLKIYKGTKLQGKSLEIGKI